MNEQQFKGGLSVQGRLKSKSRVPDMGIFLCSRSRKEVVVAKAKCVSKREYQEIKSER